MKRLLEVQSSSNGARLSRLGIAMSGLTLIEMLITLAIVSALVALVAQAMAQVQRVERLLAFGQGQAQLELVRLEQLRAALEAALPLPANSDGEFRGDSSQLQFLSADAPSVAGGRLAAIKLSLRFDADQQQTHLVLEMGTVGRTKSWVVRSWPGRSGRFNYLDASGKVHESWPLSKSSAGGLPAVLVVDPDAAGVSAAIMRLGTSPSALKSRRELLVD